MLLHYKKSYHFLRTWAYGCNCLVKKDVPMHKVIYGKPVDPLDALWNGFYLEKLFSLFKDWLAFDAKVFIRKSMKWKQCLKCAQREHGSWCSQAGNPNWSYHWHFLSTIWYDVVFGDPLKEENEYGVTGIGNPFLPHWAGGDDPICTDEEWTCNRDWYALLWVYYNRSK